jgi:P27 family predicted phage terminase small subunit
MGGRGPLPKPNELKLLEGGRGHRPIDLTSVFRPEVGLPTMPKHLTVHARKAWKRLTPELLRYNLLSRVDADALAGLCQTVGRIEVLETSLKKRQDLLTDQGQDPADAFTDQTPNGMRVQAAIYQVLNREMEKLRGLLAEFGLTPAQRARVSTALRLQPDLFDANNLGKPSQPATPVGFAEFVN